MGMDARVAAGVAFVAGMTGVAAGVLLSRAAQGHAEAAAAAPHEDRHPADRAAQPERWWYCHADELHAQGWSSILWECSPNRADCKWSETCVLATTAWCRTAADGFRQCYASKRWCESTSVPCVQTDP